MSPDAILVGLGALLLLAGILGSGLELKEVKLPALSRPMRILSVALGMAFVAIGVEMKFGSSASSSTAETTHLSPAPGESAADRLLMAGVSMAQGKPSLTEADKAEIISAIRRCDDEQTRALMTLDETALEGAWTGEALRSVTEQINALRSGGQYAEAQLQSQHFGEFKIDSTGQHVEVQAFETWSIVYYKLGTQKCVGMAPKHEAPQTLHMKRVGDGWKCDVMLFDSVRGPDPVPCGKGQ